MQKRLDVWKVQERLPPRRNPRYTLRTIQVLISAGETVPEGKDISASQMSGKWWSRLNVYGVNLLLAVHCEAAGIVLKNSAIHHIPA